MASIAAWLGGKLELETLDRSPDLFPLKQDQAVTVQLSPPQGGQQFLVSLCLRLSRRVSDLSSYSAVQGSVTLLQMAPYESLSLLKMFRPRSMLTTAKTTVL
jgi:hypothetical protein